MNNGLVGHDNMHDRVGMPSDGFFMPMPGVAGLHVASDQRRKTCETGWVFFLLFSLLVASCNPLPACSAQTTASWYSTEACRVNPHSRCPTASGQSLYDLEARGVDFAAMWDVPLGSSQWVCHAELPTRCVKVVILDRGPARRLVKHGRVIDLSKSAYQKLAALSTGTIPVTIREQ